jgi:very-short-patch-repair endonuclease
MYKEALENGIQYIGGEFGRGYFLIPCELCGKNVKKTQYSTTRNYLCDYCKGVVKKKKKIYLEQLEGIQTPNDKRFHKAVENIKSQVKDFKPYEKAIEIAKTRAEKYGSVPEAMVAIELLKNKYRITPQQKIGKYRVDFALPDQKKIIEVDGEIYHKNNRNCDREATIQFTLGVSWKIIHIPAELITNDITKLVKILNISN